MGSGLGVSRPEWLGRLEGEDAGRDILGEGGRVEVDAFESLLDAGEAPEEGEGVVLPFLAGSVVFVPPVLDEAFEGA